MARLRGPDGASPDALKGEAHALVSLAGQLGFAELADLCAELEGEAEAGGGLDRLAELSAAAGRAIEAAGGKPDPQPEVDPSPQRAAFS